MWIRKAQPWQQDQTQQDQSAGCSKPRPKEAHIPDHTYPRRDDAASEHKSYGKGQGDPQASSLGRANT